jgi:hypothetical protein
MTAIGITIIVLLAVVTVVISVAVVGASVLVTAAARREERLKSLTRRAPGRTARLARMLLAVPAPRVADDLIPRPRPAEKPAWYERSTGSTMREARSDA